MQDTALKTWRRFARGLNEPLGLVAESDQVVYIAHRPELLRAEDTDGDGEADWFKSIGGHWGLSHNYHEFFYGLRRDAAGNFYGAISLDSQGEGGAKREATDIKADQTRGAFNPAIVLAPSNHRSQVLYRGWAIKITSDGEFVPLASGLRQPNGIGLSPAGEMFTTENQGDWKPACGLIHVAPGDFLGHPSSVKWEKDYQPENATIEKLWQRFKPPAVIFPHGIMGVSSGEPVWDLTGGRFGQFGGQIFVGDYTALILRATVEKVAGAWQGAVFPFIGRNDTPSTLLGDKLNQGNLRMAFAPDGSLYLAQTAGWGGGGDGFQRISWNGENAPEILDLRLTARGFRLTFTQPMDAGTLANPENYSFTRFRYYYHHKYGSPWIDETQPKVREVVLAADERSVELALSTEDLQPGYVFQLTVPNLRTVSGGVIANPMAFYTANRLVTGQVAIGGPTRLAHPGEVSLWAGAQLPKAGVPTAALIALGKKTYDLYCVACHQTNGKGIPGGAANFIDDKTRLAKTDLALLTSIADGLEAKGMPAFRNSLKPQEMQAALTYIRSAFGDKPTASAAR